MPKAASTTSHIATTTIKATTTTTMMAKASTTFTAKAMCDQHYKANSQHHHHQSCTNQHYQKVTMTSTYQSAEKIFYIFQPYSEGLTGRWAKFVFRDYHPIHIQRVITENYVLDSIVWSSCSGNDVPEYESLKCLAENKKAQVKSVIPPMFTNQHDEQQESKIFHEGMMTFSSICATNHIVHQSCLWHPKLVAATFCALTG